MPKKTLLPSTAKRRCRLQKIKSTKFKTREEQVDEMLESLGWYQVGSGYWSHPDIDRRCYDFEALALAVKDGGVVGTEEVGGAKAKKSSGRGR